MFVDIAPTYPIEITRLVFLGSSPYLVGEIYYDHLWPAIPSEWFTGKSEHRNTREVFSQITGLQPSSIFQPIHGYYMGVSSSEHGGTPNSWLLSFHGEHPIVRNGWCWLGVPPWRAGNLHLRNTNTMEYYEKHWTLLMTLRKICHKGAMWLSSRSKRFPRTPPHTCQTRPVLPELCQVGFSSISYRVQCNIIYIYIY